MLGYFIVIVSLIFCYVYSHWNGKKAYLKSERIIHIYPDMVFILNSSLRILKLYNPNEAILLAAPKELIGMNLRDFSPEKSCISLRRE